MNSFSQLFIEYSSFLVLIILVLFSCVYYGGVTPFGLWFSGIGVGLLSLLSLVGACVSGTMKIPRSKSALCFLCIITQGMLSAYLSISMFTSFVQTLSLLLLFLLSVALYNTITQEGIESFARVLSYVTAGLAIFGMYAYFAKRYDLLLVSREFYLNRVTATFINPNHFGAMLNLSLPIMLYQVVANVKWKRVLFLVLFCLAVCALLFTYSYSSILSTIVGFVCLYVVLSKTFNLKRALVAGAFLGGLVIYVTCFSPFRLLEKSYSFYQHWKILEGSGVYFVASIIKNPLLFIIGHGLGSFQLMSQSIIPMFTFRAISFVHNEFVQAFLELGLLGGLFFIGLWTFLITGSISKAQKEHAVLLLFLKISVLSFAVHLLFDFCFHVTSLAILSVVIMSFIMKLQSSAHHVSKRLYLPVIVFMIVIALFISTRLYLGEYYLQKARPYVMKEDAQAGEYISKAISYAGVNPNILSESAELYLVLGKSILAERDVYYKKALSLFDAAIKKDSQNAKYYVRRADVYMLLDSFDNAEEDYTRAIELSPYLAAPYFKRVQFYLNDQHPQYGKGYADIEHLLTEMSSHRFQNIHEKEQLYMYVRSLIPEKIPHQPLLAIRASIAKMASNRP